MLGSFWGRLFVFQNGSVDFTKLYESGDKTWIY
jgi:hypothetical protein